MAVQDKKPTTKTTVKKTTTSKKSVAKKAPAKKTSAKKPSSTKTQKTIIEEQQKMIEVAAYYLAERNHFQGNPTDFWAAAEQEINKKVA